MGADAACVVGGNGMTNKQKKKNRNNRDSYGRLLVNGWHLEVSRAEININNDGIPIVLSADIHGYDYHGSCFSQTMIPPTQLETRDKRTETHACDCVSRQAAIDEVARWEGYLDEDMIYCIQRGLKRLPSAQSTMGQQNDGDTISRRMAIDAMANTLWHYPNECYKNLNEYEFAQGLAELGLKSVPAAQPDLSSYSDKLWRNAYERGKAEAQPEIVHCKDCKWKQGAECVRFADVRPLPDDFCSRAERRTDESN